MLPAIVWQIIIDKQDERRKIMKKKICAVLLVIAQVAALLSGCGKTETTQPETTQTENSTASEEQTTDDTATEGNDGEVRDCLNVGVIEEDWVGTDLIQSDTFYDIQMLIAEPLFLFDKETGDLKGCLASDPVFSDDGKTMTFEIPEGLYFPSGASLDAEDVKASLEWGKAEGSMKDIYALINDIQIDGNKVTVSMDSYSTPLMILLVSPFFCVIDSEQLASMTKEELLWGAQPFGPYYVTDYVEGGYVALARNESYSTNNYYVENKGLSNIPKVVINFVQDEYNAIAGLTTGEFDLVINLSADGANEAETMENVEVSSALPPMVRNLQFNCTSEELSDENVRLAIALLIDRDNIVETFGGAAEPAYSYITENVLFHTDETDEYFKTNYANNAEKAMELLKEAGYEDTDGDGYLDKNGKVLELDFATATGKNETAAIAIQMQLESAGIKTNLMSSTSSDTNQKMVDKDYDIAICNYWWSEPSKFLQSCFKDHGNFDETEYMAMCEEIGSLTDNEARFELVDSTQRYLMDTLSVIPLYTTTYIKAYKSDLSDIKFITDGMFINDCK